MDSQAVTPEMIVQNLLQQRHITEMLQLDERLKRQEELAVSNARRQVEDEREKERDMICTAEEVSSHLSIRLFVCLSVSGHWVGLSLVWRFLFFACCLCPLLDQNRHAVTVGHLNFSRLSDCLLVCLTICQELNKHHG